MSIQRKDRLPALIIFACFLLQWALLMVVITPVWDAAFYYAYARSTLFDGDLALENDLLLSYPTAGEQFVNKQAHANLTETGRVVSPFAIGSSILYLPVMAWLRLLVWVTGQTATYPTGYEWLYVGTVATFSALMAFAAFWLTYRLATALAGRGSALLATLTLMLATPLLYYQFREPLYAHAASAFSTALLVFVWWRQQGRPFQPPQLPSPAQAFLLGGLLGLVVLVRWQNGIYAVLPLASTFMFWHRTPGRFGRETWRQIIIYLLLVGLAAALAISLQLAQWRLFNGSWLLVPQGEGFMDFRAPFIDEVLFSPFRGLLAWMPLFFPAVVGLALLARRRPAILWPLILVLALSLFVNSSTPDWFAGGGYGPRRFTSETIIFGLGYAGFLAAFRPAWRYALAGLLVVLLGWHQWLLLRFGLVDQIGGRVLSMYPRFDYEGESWAAFLGDLWGHAPTLFRDPAGFLIFPGSPLDMLLTHNMFPGRHIITLLLAMLFLIGGWWLWRRTRSAWLWLGAGLVVILVGNVWLILWA